MRVSRRSFVKRSAATVAAASLGNRFAIAQDGPIRIGTIYDLSGPFAAAGSVASSIGAQTAIDLVNERGGVAGKYKVEAVNADSQSKADAAINEVERLINQEKVEIVLGVYSSAHAVPLAAKMQEAKKNPWITTAVATSVVKGRNLTYTFRAQIHSDQYGQASAGFLADNASKIGEPGKTKVAVIHEDGPYGVGVGEAGERFAKEKGFQIVLREGYSAAAPDLSSLVTKLKRAQADIILHTGYNPDITLFLRQARESGLRFKMLIGNGAGYSQIDKLRATFAKDVDDFCNIDPVPAQLLKPREPGARPWRSHQDHGRPLQGQDQRRRRSPARLHGLQPDLGSAQQRSAGRQGQVRRVRRGVRTQGRPRCRHSSRGNDPGLRREILPAGS